MVKESIRSSGLPLRGAGVALHRGRLLQRRLGQRVKGLKWGAQTTLHQGVNARPQVMASGVSAEFTGMCSIFDSFTPINASMQGVPDGVVSGPKCMYPWACCKLQGLCFTRTAKQSPGGAGEKRPGCSPSCPFSYRML